MFTDPTVVLVIEYGIIILMVMLFILIFTSVLYIMTKINKPLQIQLLGDVVTRQEGHNGHVEGPQSVEIVKEAVDVSPPPPPPVPPLRERVAGILISNGKSMTPEDIAGKLKEKGDKVKRVLTHEKALFQKAGDSNEWGLVKWMKEPTAARSS